MSKGGKSGEEAIFMKTNIVVKLLLVVTVVSFTLSGCYTGGQETIPSTNPPVKQEPVKQEPVKQEPVKQEPVKQEPVKQEPVKQEPVKQQPVKQHP
jgi:hypothetical protein